MCDVYREACFIKNNVYEWNKHGFARWNFPEQWVMCTVKHILVKRMFTSGLYIDLPLWACIKKTLYGVETHWPSSKKIMITVFWDMKWPITIEFLKKEATVNSACYCQLL